MAAPTELVVHIGQGKTGSTAIQHLCEERREDLRSRGVAYLGSMLEYCGTPVPFGWQRRRGAHALFHQMPDDEAAEQIHDVLSGELARLGQGGIARAVWSNEALLARNSGAGSALLRLRDEGHPVRLIAYVRRHDAWARSAYAQWGIMHKSYDGPVKNFADWIAERPVHFAHHLEYWDGLFGDDLDVLNYDVIPDVAVDFLGRIGADGLGSLRALSTPRPAALAAWAVHNSRRRGEAMPAEFERLMKPSGVLNLGWPDLPEPGRLLPSEDDLARVREASAEDARRVNALLDARGEPGLDMARPLSIPKPPEDWEFISMLMTLVFSLQEQVEDLRTRLENLGG